MDKFFLIRGFKIYFIGEEMFELVCYKCVCFGEGRNIRR